MFQLRFDKPLVYQPEIDGLRALAVSAVIANHFNSLILPSGFLGVDIFFVISGYVISGALAARLKQPLPGFLVDFYRRRFKRIFPALGLFVLITSVCVAVIDPTPRTTLKTGLYALFGLSNLYLYSQSTDYFSEDAELNAFTHTWSLGVEEQFYLIFPLLVWFLVRAGKSVGPAIFSLIALSLAGFLVLSDHAASFAFFSPVTRFWELSAGVVAFGLRQTSSRWTNRPAFANAVLVGLVASLFLPADEARWTTVVVVGLTAFLLVLLDATRTNATILSTRLAVSIGRISYSLYLWHWFVLWLSRLTIGIEWWTVPFQLGAIFAAAIASYRFVENPLRYRPWSASVSRGFIYGAAAVSVIALSSAALDSVWRGKLYIGHLVGHKLPDHLLRTWWVDKATGTNLEPCHLHGYDRSALQNCLGNAPQDSRTIFLIGDSHARNYLPTIRSVFAHDTIRYLTVGHGCAFVDANTALALKKYRCPDYVRDVEDVIARSIKPGDIVVIGQRLFEMDPSRTGPGYFAKLSTFASELARTHASLILLDGVLPPSYPPERCLNVPWRRAELQGCTVPADTVKTAFKAFDAAAQSFAHDHRNVFYVPLRTGLCGSELCGQALPDGTPVWHDRGHITENAAVALAPLLRASLQRQDFPF